jgi:16S rRNA (cytosine1402-N4)-methyltransferase
MPRSPGKYIDATVGAGGHAWGILEHSAPDGLLLALDRDPQALAIASQRLFVFKERVTLAHASYVQLLDEMLKLNWSSVDGIVFDLGLSSMQLDSPERGFSFQSEGPLDMRFDPTQSLDAAELVNRLPEQELADLIWRYGEERASRRIAAAIVRSRPVATTKDLAELISKAVGGQRSRIHPATRTFQALRIAVNSELQSIEQVLPQTVQALAPGGRVAIISFHSMEDRLVKHFFRNESRDCICPPEQPDCDCEHKASLKVITRHPIIPSEEETLTNPRARSARLRVAEKLSMA